MDKHGRLGRIMVQLMKKIKQAIINVPDVEVTINWNKSCVLTLLILGILAASLGKGIYLYINTFILFLFCVMYALIEFNDNNDFFRTSCSALRQSIFFWYCIYGVLNWIICTFLINYNIINIFIICETVALIIISIVVFIIVLISNYKNSQKQQNDVKQTKLVIVYGNIFIILASIIMLIAVNLKGLIGLLYCVCLWVAILMVILLLPIQMAIANCIKYKIIVKEKPTQ